MEIPDLGPDVERMLFRLPWWIGLVWGVGFFVSGLASSIGRGWVWYATLQYTGAMLGVFDAGSRLGVRLVYGGRTETMLRLTNWRALRLYRGRTPRS